jgi:hypothetical protein
MFSEDVQVDEENGFVLIQRQGMFSLLIPLPLPYPAT